MDTRVVEILKKKRYGALAVNLPDGSPHAAAMAFAYEEKPLELFFLTDNKSRKMQLLHKGIPQKASFVIGFSEHPMVTLQIEGEIKVVEDRGRIEEIKKIYFGKYPSHKRYFHPGTSFLVLTPIWWRYTDFMPIPNLVISS